MNPLVAAIIAAIAPIVGEWLKKWLESRLGKSAAELRLNTATTGNAALVIQHAIDSTPRYALGRRWLLRTMHRHSDSLADGKLPASAHDELREAVAAADES
jgi:hypothetical protein